MALTNLTEDLIGEFREESTLIKQQIEILDPLGTSLRKPAAQRLLSNTTLIISEIGCYLLSVGSIGFLVMAHTVYPFSVLHSVYITPEINNRLGAPNVNNLILAGYGVVVGLALIFLLLGYMSRTIRQKNAILQQAGTDIKIIVGQHLERKAAIDALDHRHMLITTDMIAQPSKKKIGHQQLSQIQFDDAEDNDD